MSFAAQLRSCRALVRFAAPALGSLNLHQLGVQALPRLTSPLVQTPLVLGAATTPSLVRCFGLDAVQTYLVSLGSSQGPDH
ncbi:hypothetical protein TSOC_002605 [Tetrabaena socialis]|uniref:Uncharacterized protein n=1 Tax=Tetrabaena socialis TaxID=47790 RepID=A0A2J8ADP8_9CHLO|nr:hypothetical protein TSOC_002605 [Tetrabaena socialis]|eukprot:PNH10651.1 hypothetical protein TSOC_002605 [Tetrabaena socialis]